MMDRKSRRILCTVLCTLAVAACSAPSGSSRECSFAHPILLSQHSIAGLDDDDARALLAFNRTAQEVCK